MVEGPIYKANITCLNPVRTRWIVPTSTCTNASTTSSTYWILTLVLTSSAGRHNPAQGLGESALIRHDGPPDPTGPNYHGPQYCKVGSNTTWKYYVSSPGSRLTIHGRRRVRDELW